MSEQVKLPEPFRYPAGDVVGACACGSWPGGPCLKCPPVNFYTAEQMQAAVLREREACAAIADRQAELHEAGGNPWTGTANMLAIAATIRAQGR